MAKLSRLSRLRLARLVLGFWLAASLTALAPDAGADGISPLLLEVTVNGETPVDGVYAFRDAQGRLYLRTADLKSWRLKASAPTVELRGESYVQLDQVEGLAYQLSDQTQTLTIFATPKLFVDSKVLLGDYDPGPMTEPNRGGFLNYDIHGEFGSGQQSFGAVVEAGVFAGGGAGATSAVALWNEGDAKLTRLETNWTFDRPDNMRSLRLGDSIARGSASTPPFRFAGLQWGRNFAVRPGYVTLPVPTLSGSAALPSTAEVYVNNVLSASETVAPGPFQIVDAPVLAGNGEMRLVVTDPLGRQSVTTVGYYGANQLLRQGLSDDSYEIGFIREAFGRKSMSYGALFASATHRYGFSRYLTGEVHAEISRTRQLAGGSASVLVPGGGVLTVSTAGSRSPLGSGGLAGAEFERRSLGLSFSGRAQFATPNFSGVWADGSYRLPRTSFTGAVSAPLGRGYLSATYVARSGNKDLRERYFGLGGSFDAGRFGSLSLSAHRHLGERKRTALEMFFTVPFGRKANFSAGHQRTQGSHFTTAAVQRSLPLGPGYGYRALASAGETKRLEGEFTYRTASQTYDAGAAYTKKGAAFRAGVSGTLAMVERDFVVLPTASDSFAVVRTGGFPGVRVYADNQLVGRTNGKGMAVVPQLRPYDRNVIRIEQGDLPLDVDVETLERVVRPFMRNGVRVDYGFARANGATLVAFLESGAAVPAGAVARLDGSPTPFVVAPGGNLYFTGLKARNRVVIEWTGGRCSFVLAYRPGSDPQPRLGRHICRTRNDA